MNLENMPREAWIALIVLIILALGFDPSFFVLLVLAGLLYLARNMMENNSSTGSNQPPIVTTNNRRRQQPTYEEEYYEEEFEEPASRRSPDQPHDHALEAIKSAGRNPHTLQVLPLDIGLISFKGKDEPVIYQVAPVPDDVDYVQPYIELKLPRTAKGRLKFELVDRTWRVVFAHEDNYQFQKGNNLIVPTTRLKAQGIDVTGGWKLRVSADTMLIAQHSFEWEDTEAVNAGIRAHIEEDGEISNELRSALAENRLQKMSLDELLSFQDEDEQPRARKK